MPNEPPMKIKDAVSQRKLEGKRPAGVVLAFKYRQTLNEVVLYDQWRFRLVKEITRDEFEAAMAYNVARPDAVLAETKVRRSRIDIENATDRPTIPEGMKHFYRAELI